MPYISSNKRPELDVAIEQLADRILAEAKASGCANCDAAGLLNYSISRLLGRFIEGGEGQVRYKVLNMLVGMLGCVQLELYRRLAASYEDKMIIQNGDVDAYDHLSPVAPPHHCQYQGKKKKMK